MEKMRKNNRGFSLIELIVAVLIMAIISGGAFVALGSIFSTKTKAAAVVVQDALKQARIDAISLDNDIVALVSGETAANGYATNIYVKFHVDNSQLLADVCSNKSGSEYVLNTKVIASDKFSLQFCKKDGTLVDEGATVGSATAYVYFKKATGGVSRLTIDGVGKYSSCDMIKVVSPSGEVVDVILVSLTGRSYVDY